MTTIDQWEAEAKDESTMHGANSHEHRMIMNKRILSLIDIAKEMAEALEDVCLNKDAAKINWHKANRILEQFKEWR